MVEIVGLAHACNLPKGTIVEYIPTDWSISLPYFLGAIFFALVVLTYLVLGIRGKLDWVEEVSKLKVVLFFVVPLVISMLALILLIFISLAAPGSKLGSDVQEQIKDTYGLELSPRETSKLNYPNGQPRDGVVGYGSTELFLKDGDGFVRSEVFLISSEGKFYLADNQGESLKVLSDSSKPSADSE